MKEGWKVVKHGHYLEKDTVLLVSNFFSTNEIKFYSMFPYLINKGGINIGVWRIKQK